MIIDKKKKKRRRERLIWFALYLMLYLNQTKLNHIYLCLYRTLGCSTPLNLGVLATSFGLIFHQKIIQTKLKKQIQFSLI